MAIKRDDAGLVMRLLQRGFDPNTPNPEGVHGLHLALREPSLKVTAVLIDWKETQFDIRSAQDESPLMLAALKGLTSVCERLISRGADVNKPGWTALHYAATHGHIDVMNLLLEHSAYIDAASPNGSTPLMMAAMYANAGAVKLLLEAGADPLLTNDLKLTALDFAQQGNHLDSAQTIAAFIRGRQPRGKW